MKHLKLFNEDAEYQAFKETEEYILPNVSYVEGINVVYYNPYEENETESDAVKVGWIQTPVDLSLSLGSNEGRDCFYIFDENDNHASGFKYTTKENKDNVSGNYYYFEYDNEYIDVIDSVEITDRYGDVGYSITINAKQVGDVVLTIYAGSKKYGEFKDSNFMLYIM